MNTTIWVCVALFVGCFVLLSYGDTTRTAKESISFFLLKISILFHEGERANRGFGTVEERERIFSLIEKNFKGEFQRFIINQRNFPDRKLKFYNADYKTNTFLVKVLPMLKEVHKKYRQANDIDKATEDFFSGLKVIIAEEIS
ncbi:MAG: hypothetical protein WCJ45_06410 [bacterium]